ncbi:MAG TPA: DUF6265 family protein [Candidatus Limnocylindria bacterium]|nr:DUF6265 family protein [Candidatus Limnocylindria bacterium]
MRSSRRAHTRRTSIAAALVAGLSSFFAVPAPAAQGSLERLAWLAGCWEMRRPRGVTHEQWMAPGGGMMLGASRTVIDGRTVEFEAVRIEAQEGALIYVANPSRQTPATFRQIELTDSSVVFANPEHDFPQRIRYRLRGDGSLLAQIEGLRGDSLRIIDYPMTRARCEAVRGR